MVASLTKKNVEKSGLVKLLRKQFPLKILLQLIGLKHPTFFYYFAEIVQKTTVIFYENSGNYSYRRIMLMLYRIWTIKRKKSPDHYAEIGLTRKM